MAILVRNGLALGGPPLPDPMLGVRGGNGRTGPSLGSSRSGVSLALHWLPPRVQQSRSLAPGGAQPDRAGARLQSRPILATPWGSQSCDPVPEGLHAGLPPMGAAIPRPGAGRAQPDRAGARLLSRPIRATPWGSQSCDPVPEGTARRARSPAPSPVRLGRPPRSRSRALAGGSAHLARSLAPVPVRMGLPP